MATNDETIVALMTPLLLGFLRHPPTYALTNNAAERQLRHWVVARKISFGTRSELGTRALALLASIIDTCRLRKASAWNYLADAIRAGRAGAPIPPLPAVGV